MTESSCSRFSLTSFRIPWIARSIVSMSEFCTRCNVAQSFLNSSGSNCALSHSCSVFSCCGWVALVGCFCCGFVSVGAVVSAVFRIWTSLFFILRRRSSRKWIIGTSPLEPGFNIPFMLLRPTRRNQGLPFTPSTLCCVTSQGKERFSKNFKNFSLEAEKRILCCYSESHDSQHIYGDPPGDPQ